jgi:chaperonin GroEL (HSP60 family)
VTALGPADGGDALEFPQANIIAVRAIAAALATTLGPRSGDKLVIGEQPEDTDVAPGSVSTSPVTVTSDGGILLERLPIEHPIAPVLRRMVGPERPGETGIEGEVMPDVTTTRAVLAGALLDRAEALIDDGLHPRSIIEGHRRAQEVAREEIMDTRIRLQAFDSPGEAKLATAKTAMTGNLPGGNLETWAALVVDAVDLVDAPDEETFVVRQTSAGRIGDSTLIRGTVLDRNQRASTAMPKRVDDAAVLVLDGHDRGGLKERDAPDNVTAALCSGASASNFKAMRRERKERLVEGYSDLGVDVVLTRSGIDRDYQRLLVDRGIVGIRGVTALELARVAKATGARRVMDPADVSSADLGSAGHVFETRLGPYPGRRKRRRMIVFEDCPNPDSVAVLLRGVTGQTADQATVAVRKGAFAVTAAEGTHGRQGGVVPGGGAVHIAVAETVRDAARREDSRAQLAMDAYADAAERVVWTLARNGGLDSIDTVAATKAARSDGKEAIGVVYPDGEIGDCLTAGILDPVRVVDDAYLHATDVASLVLGIDDTIDAEPSEEPVETDDVIYDEPAELQEQSQRDR